MPPRTAPPIAIIEAAAPWSVRGFDWDVTDPVVVRVMRGRQFLSLDEASQHSLFRSDFTVAKESDRMGFRLSGTRLTLHDQRELISSGVCAGTVQLPPHGDPIVLMADCATAGGYARIAHVATVDLPLVAQTRPGGRLRLAEISVGQAQSLHRAREALLRQIQCGIRLHL